MDVGPADSGIDGLGAGGAEHARRPVVVASWSSRSAGHDSRDWFVGDELHFIEGAERRDLGVHAYVDVVADGVDECRSRLGA